MTDSVTKTMGALAAVAASVWVLWSAWEVAVGGQIPLIGWSLGPSLAGAVLFVIIAEPVATTLAYLAATVVCLPLMALPGPRPAAPPATVTRSGRAMARTWGTIGSLVLGVEHLQEGHVYHLGSDLGEYRGPHQPKRSHRAAAPDEPNADEPVVRYVFELARTSEMERDRASAHLSRKDVLDSVREVPAPQHQAREVFAEIRSGYLAELREAEEAKLGTQLPVSPARRSKVRTWGSLIGGALVAPLSRQGISSRPH
ncbi:MAG: hypothetical protein ACRDOY_03235 [Nocardioidaceae bacterium]